MRSKHLKQIGLSDPEFFMERIYRTFTQVIKNERKIVCRFK